MNNKLVLIIGGALLLVGLGAFLFLQNSSQQNQQVENISEENIEEEANTVLNAFEGTGSVVCSYDDGTSQATVQIKNGMVRVESTGSDESSNGNVILKDDTLWIWEAGSTEGVMIENISQYESDPNVQEEYSVNKESIQEEIEKNNASCIEQNISDGVFELPSDVVFQDFSSQLENIQDQLPEGYEIPEGIELPSY